MSSEKFVQLNIPCKECLVSPICQDKQKIDQELEQHKGELMEFFLSLRKWDESKKVYRKGLIEAWANMGWDIFSHMGTTDFKDIPNHARPEFLNLLIELSSLIQWIINSKSWEDGEVYDFDQFEIKAKLKKAMNWI